MVKANSKDTFGSSSMFFDGDRSLFESDVSLNYAFSDRPPILPYSITPSPLSFAPLLELTP
ncbi:MAG: hypothetical protein F6K09_11095 [Merismopedia sp. SIO2A8]|nr:hypothetical protein [Symploca sp. SIO2B6]NET49249.1 hypothetical protein [Merismopedia sp. SIO2A8]